MRFTRLSVCLPQLILASTSPYRRALLERLGVGFEGVAPGVDEHHLTGESPTDRALRRAPAKAKAVAARPRAALIIGSDQVAPCGAEVLDKPGDAGRCREQLGSL